MDLFLPQEIEIELIFAYGQRFPRYRPIFRIAVFGYETWNFEKSSRSCIWTLFLPRGSKLSLVLLYGQRFSRYGLIFKMTIFGHETLINLIN